MAKEKLDLSSGEDIDIADLIKKKARREKRALPPAVFGPARLTYSNEKPNADLKSFFFDPLSLETNYYGTVRTISPFYGRQISCRILRRVSEKAWILNLCIGYAIKQARPFYKVCTGENQRGFQIRHREAKEIERDMKSAEKKEAKRLAEFFLHTGDVYDPNRIDDLDKYCTKIIRDLYQLDQISVELQRMRGREVCAFWAMDTATIEIALPNTERETGVKYAQVINNIPYAYYTADDLIYDCLNPRTDLERAGYGYSIVEQAIDLVTSAINTFMFNAGAFTEDRLPRGFLLLNGSADQNEIEDIEDYISNLMSGPPTSKWRVPIIPSGRSKNTENSSKVFEWVKLQETNKDMEYQNWLDLQYSAIVAMFGRSMEELGLHSQKSQPLFANNTEPKIEASKSLGLGDLLTYLQKHFNRILEYKNPDFEFEFVGYERDDPKLVSDIDREEIGAWKTLNEKRIEKGMDPIDLTTTKNPADLPMNPYAVQLFQSQQAMGGGMGGMPGGFGEEGDEDGSGWGEIEDGIERGAPGEDGGEPSGDEEGEADWDEIEKDSAASKSLSRGEPVRIVV